jgi:glycosyltransferase involved in cell wall biosynthesis
MNVLHIIPYLGRAQGGPVESLRLLASAQAELGHRVRVIYTGVASDGDPAIFPANVEVINLQSMGVVRWCPTLTDSAFLGNFDPDVVHSHGLWLDASRQAEKISSECGVPHIISPCGMLQHDALRRSRWKKRLAWYGFQKRVFASASVFHAKSDAEATEILSLLPQAKVTVIPNAIEPWQKISRKKSNSSVNATVRIIFEKSGLLPSHKLALFMGRIHPVKGLERLLGAWLKTFRSFPDWRLVIVGPDDDGYRSKLEAMSGEKVAGKNNGEVGSTIIFLGAIYGEDRWGVYTNVDLFVTPSDFENFGQSIAEALCAGVPVITTTSTPWKLLKEKGCGWWVDPSQEGIAVALQEAMSLTVRQRTAMGNTGRQIVQQYSPSRIAKRMCSLYASCLTE